MADALLEGTTGSVRLLLANALQGEREKLIDAVTSGTTVTRQGICYVRPEQPAGWSIRFFRPESVPTWHRSASAAPGGLTSPGGDGSVLQIDQEGSDHMLRKLR